MVMMYQNNKNRQASKNVAHLELMLGQIANYCTIRSRDTNVKKSISAQTIGTHYLEHTLDSRK